MPPRLPSLGKSPAKAMSLPHIQPVSPHPNANPQSQIFEPNLGSAGFGSDPAMAEASQGPDQGNSADSTSMNIQAGALPSEAPFQDDVYNGPIPLKTLALSEKGTIEQLAESLETLSRKNSPTLGSFLGIDGQISENHVLQSSPEDGEGGSGSGSAGSTALGDAAKNAVYVLKRLEKRRLNLGQTYMVTVKDAYECLKETEHLLEEHHSQVSTQIFDQVKILTTALDEDFKTLQRFFEKEKKEQEKQDNELRQKVDQVGTSAVAAEKAITDADTKISGLLHNLKQTVEGLTISLDEIRNQFKEGKERQENDFFEKVDQAGTSAAAAVMANSETRISELVGKVEAAIQTLDTALDSKIEASQNRVFDRAAEAQMSVLKTGFEGFQPILKGLSDNIHVLATQGSATAALLHRVAESQKQQQTFEEKLTANWAQKLNSFEEQLKTQTARILELEKPLESTPVVPHVFATVVEPNDHPAFKLAVAGNYLLPHLQYHRHRFGIDWELSAGFHKDPSSLHTLLQNRWFVGFSLQPFMNLALQTLSSRSGVDGRGYHTIRKLQIQNFHYIKELGETDNYPYSRVEIGWNFGPMFKNGSFIPIVNLGGFWLDASQNSFGNVGTTSIVRNVTGLASDLTDAVKEVPFFWRFFSKTDWYISSGATFDTKYWYNSHHFPVGTKIHGTLQVKVPGNKDDSMKILHDHIIRVETKIDAITKKVTSVEPKITDLTHKLKNLEPKVYDVSNRLKSVDPRMGSLTQQIDAMVTKVEDQEKCCHTILKKIENLENKPAGENTFSDTQPTETTLEVSKSLMWSAILEVCFGFTSGVVFGFFYLFLLRQQLCATTLFEKNLYRTGRFLIPGGYLSALFVSLVMITINFLCGLPLESKWPIIQKIAEFSESMVKKIPGQETNVAKKLHTVVFYVFSFGFPFASVGKLFQTTQTPSSTLFMCIRLTVSFVVFSKITCWWTTWLISDSELVKNQHEGLNVPAKDLEAPFGNRLRMQMWDQSKGLEPPKLNPFLNYMYFSLEIFAIDPLELPGVP